MALAMSSMVTSLRNTRLQAASYDRLRVRNDENLSVSPTSNERNNLTGLTLREILADDQANINDLLAKKKDTVEAWSKTKGGLLGLDVMLADMRDLVKKVAAGGMSNVKAAENQSLFEAIMAGINSLLTGTEHKGEQLMISADALVSVDMSALASALTAAQANVDPNRAAALLGGEFGGDESSGTTATSEASAGASSGPSEPTTAKLAAYTQKDAE